MGIKELDQGGQGTRLKSGIKEQDQGWGSRNKIKDQDQGWGSSDKIQDGDQGTINKIRMNYLDKSVAFRVFIKDQGQGSGSNSGLILG